MFKIDLLFLEMNMNDYEKNVFFKEILSILNHEISLYFLSKAYLVLIRVKP